MHKFAQDLVLDPSDPADKEKYGLGVYLPYVPLFAMCTQTHRCHSGTLRTPTNPSDETTASLVKTSARLLLGLKGVGDSKQVRSNRRDESNCGVLIGFSDE